MQFACSATDLALAGEQRMVLTASLPAATVPHPRCKRVGPHPLGEKALHGCRARRRLAVQLCALSDGAQTTAATARTPTPGPAAATAAAAAGAQPTGEQHALQERAALQEEFLTRGFISFTPPDLPASFHAEVHALVLAIHSGMRSQ